jgi:hypothetical protein
MLPRHIRILIHVAQMHGIYKSGILRHIQ